jgi:hypothetical protein
VQITPSSGRGVTQTHVSGGLATYHNLHGRYEFKGLARSIDIDAIVLELSQLPITQAIIV